MTLGCCPRFSVLQDLHLFGQWRPFRFTRSSQSAHSLDVIDHGSLQSTHNPISREPMSGDISWTLLSSLLKAFSSLKVFEIGSAFLSATCGAWPFGDSRFKLFGGVPYQPP